MDNILAGLLVCGLMGLIGQGTRAIVGLSETKVLSSSSASRQSTFTAAYLTVSLIIGFIAGVLAGMALNVPNANGVAPTIPTLLGLISAGYAGTDFIENTFAKLLPSIGLPLPRSSSSTPQANTTSQLAKDMTVQSLSDTVQSLSSSIASMSVNTGAVAAVPAPTTSANFDLLSAVRVVLPTLDTVTWIPLLKEAFNKYNINTPLRVAAVMGQFVAEVGESFQELQENMSYSAAQLLRIFPNEVKDQATADSLVGNPQAIGNLVYANRNGNGDVASGDGFKFRGGGLCQLTGRTEYTEFAAAAGMDVDQAVAYVATFEGAAISGCWYVYAKGCLPLADQWKLTAITSIVNGSGLEALNTRIDYANRFRNAFGVSIPNG